MPLHLAARSLLAKADFFVGEKWQVHSISWGLQSIGMQSNIQSYPTNRSHSKSYTVWFLGIHRMSIESPWYNCKWFFIVFLSKTLRVLIAAQGFFQERGLNIWRSGYLKSVISRRFFGRRIWKIIWFAEEANESLVPVRNLTNVNWRGTISKGKAGLPSCIFWRGFSLLVFGGVIYWKLEVLLGHVFCSPPLKVDIDMLQASSVRWMHPSMPPPWTGGNAITHQGV